MRRAATIDYRVSRVPILCKDCGQDVGLYPARHVCYSETRQEPPPPLPIFDRAMSLRSQASNTEAHSKAAVADTGSAPAETVERAKMAVGRGWEIVRNINWRDGTRKDPESNGSRVWGRLLEATSSARQKVADKYHEVREGGNESDDDTPDNTHTQRVLAQYYLTTDGALPAWLPAPPSLSPGGNTSHNPSISSSTSGSSSVYRAGIKQVSLQDIYDSAGPNSSSSSQPRSGRNYDLYGDDQGASVRPSPAGDRLRTKLRPSNARPSAQPGSGDQDGDTATYNRSGYSGRSGFGVGDNYDPYSYQQSSYDSGRPRDQRQGQGQSSGGLPSRPIARR